MGIGVRAGLIAVLLTTALASAETSEDKLNRASVGQQKRATSLLGKWLRAHARVYWLHRSTDGPATCESARFVLRDGVPAVVSRSQDADGSLLEFFFSYRFLEDQEGYVFSVFGTDCKIVRLPKDRHSGKGCGTFSCAPEFEFSVDDNGRAFRFGRDGWFADRKACEAAGSTQLALKSFGGCQ